MTRTKLAIFSRMLADAQSGASRSGSRLSRTQSSHFGFSRGGWAAMAHWRFLLLVFCLIPCLRGLASAQVLETWTNSNGQGNGLWSNGNNWSPPTKPGGPNGNYNVTIPCCTVESASGPIMDVSASIVNLTIQADASLSITNRSTLTITGTTISNNGLLTIAIFTGYAKGGTITIENTVTLSGTGSVSLNSFGPLSAINGSGTLINQQTINGTAGGAIYVALQNVGPSGLITGGPSTHPLWLYGSVTNSGKILGQGFTTVAFYKNTVQNAEGTIDGGGGGGQVLLYGCKVIGGTIGSASAVASTSTSSAPTLNGVTIAPTGIYSVTSTSTLISATTLEGTIANDGQIRVTGAELQLDATLYISGSVTLSGTGQIAMSGANASIEGQDLSATLTNAYPHVINGGTITGLSTLTNVSTISNATMISNIDKLVNTGATLEDIANISGVYVDDGTIEAPVNPGTTVTNSTFSGVTFTGGTQGVVYPISATLNGVEAVNTVETNFVVNGNSMLTLKGPTVAGAGGEVDLNGLLPSAPATVVVEGAASVTGTGEWVTSLAPYNYTVGAAGTKNSLTINLPMVSTEGWNLGDGTFPITFGATNILTSGGDPLIINVGTNSFTNLGTMANTSPGSLVEILGNFTNFNSTTNTLTRGNYMLGGPLQFNNANLVNNSANLTLDNDGQIENQSAGNGLANFNNNTATGTFELSGGQSFETGGTFNNEGTSIISAGSDFTVGGTSTNYNQSGTTAITTVDGTLIVPAGGLTSITGGALHASGQFQGNVSVGNTAGGAAATLIVGDSRKSSALVTMLNNYTQLATGVMDAQIGGTTAGTQYSQLSVTGDVTLGGTLNVVLTNKFKPVSGDQFTIINAPSGVTGTFATVNLPPKFQVVYNPTNVELEVQ